jgi:hypothetical protein
MHYVTRSTLGKKMGLQVDSVRREDGERVYTLVS